MIKDWSKIYPKQKMITYRNGEFVVVHVVNEVFYGSRLTSEGQRFINVARDMRDVEAGKGQWTDVRNLHLYSEEMFSAICALQERQEELDNFTHRLRKGKIPSELLQLKMI